MTSKNNEYIRFVFDFKEIDTFDKLKFKEIENKTLEDLGLKDNSIIYFTNECRKYNKEERIFSSNYF